MKRFMYSLIFLSIIAILAACSSGTNDNNNNGEEEKQITIKMATTHISGDWLEEMKPKVEEKFPNITLELVEMPAIDSDEFEDEIYKGNIPDILPVLEQRRDFMIAREYELEEDFEEILEKKDFDLSVYDESIIQSLRNATPTNGIVGLPIQSNYFAINYNKDIFDQFGVDYPDGEMTWSELMNLADEMTKEFNGTQYRGVTMNAYLAPFIFSQFEENIVDSETNEVNVTKSEAMQAIFTMLDEYASIPDNLPSGDFGTDFEAGNVAMDINWARTYNIEDGIQGMNFDFAPFPTWEENPGIGPEPNVTTGMIMSTSEHKEEAFDVLAYLTSEEARLSDIKNGSIPVLANPEVKEQFMGDMENADEYRLDLLEELTISNGPPEINLYENTLPLREAMEEFVTEKRGTDVNQYLREVEQEIENYILDEENKK